MKQVIRRGCDRLKGLNSQSMARYRNTYCREEVNKFLGGVVGD